MVFCNFCRQFSQQDYTCPNCKSSLKIGYKVVSQFKISNCDRCGYLLPYKKPVWRVNSNYYHADCYEKKDPHQNLSFQSSSSQSSSSSSSSSSQSSPSQSSSSTISKKLKESFTLFGVNISNTKKSKSFEDSESVDGINWPDSDLIDKAFENLPKYGSHEKIRQFVVVRDRMDLPLSFPGQFARVYKVQDSKNEKKFAALRFFTKKKEGSMMRYKILHDYFEPIFQKGRKLNFFTNFEYLTRSLTINIKKEAIEFPVIKMDWIEGITLEHFMQSCSDKNKLRKIREKFKKIVDEMEELEIAHGDLHPKNIIINENDDIKLVDYDCVYVMDFKGDNMPELGDPDCQHPNRKEFKYDHSIDRFSSIVLYLALMVVEEKPEFAQLRDGDFIFSQDDYKNPSTSETFKKISQLSPEIQYLLNILIDYCKKNRPSIDSLSTILQKT